MSLNVDWTGAYKMNEIKELGDFPGSNTIRIGWSYPAHGQFGANAAWWPVDGEYSPTGPLIDPWGRRVQGYCDKGIHLDPNNGPQRGSQYGSILGGEIVPCQDVGGYVIKPGHSFQPYTWSMAPSLTFGEGTLTMTALVDAGFGRIYADRMKQWHDRYNTSYESLSQNIPMYAAGYRLGQAEYRAYFDGDFIKLREVGIRYQLPSGVAERIGADRAAIAFSGRELANLYTGHQGLGYPVTAKDLNTPPMMPLDPETGRGAEGDGGHRSYPPLSSFSIRFDLTF
jgi:hypothetical protein